jgi:hypothetical protein
MPALARGRAQGESVAAGAIDRKAKIRSRRFSLMLSLSKHEIEPGELRSWDPALALRQAQGEGLIGISMRMLGEWIGEGGNARLSCQG